MFQSHPIRRHLQLAFTGLPPGLCSCFKDLSFSAQPPQNDSLFILLHQWLSALAAQRNQVECLKTYRYLRPNPTHSDLTAKQWDLDIRVLNTPPLILKPRQD